jgi:hypothetical protein
MSENHNKVSKDLHYIHCPKSKLALRLAKFNRDYASSLERPGRLYHCRQHKPMGLEGNNTASHNDDGHFSSSDYIASASNERLHSVSVE